MTAHVGLEDVTHLVDTLSATDLMPGPRVDRLFTSLVACALRVGPDHPLLGDRPALAEIHRLCAVGEANLETVWAQEIAADPRRLCDFPYLDNYRDLASAELRVLRRTLPHPIRHLVFAGCGPLPLSAVEYARNDPCMEITCLDVDPAAVVSARAVLTTLGHAGQIEVALVDAAEHDYAGADVVVFAALVGESAQRKRDFIERIAPRLDQNALLAVRSVPEDGRQLLYPRVLPGRLSGHVQVVAEWLPPANVINSLLLLRPRAVSGRRSRPLPVC